MFGQVHGLLHLVEAAGLEQRQRVLLPLDRAVLQRGEDLGEGHRRRVRAKRLPGGHEQRHVGHPQLEAVQLVRGGDGAVGRQVARAAREIGQGADVGIGDDLGLDLVADLARGDLVHVLQRAVGIGQRQQRGLGRPVLQAFAGDGHVGGAQLHAVDDVDLLAQGFVRKDLDLDPALGPGGDLLGEMQGGLVPDVFLVGQVAQLQRDVGGHRGAGGQCGGQGDGDHAGRCHGVLLQGLSGGAGIR